LGYSRKKRKKLCDSFAKEEKRPNGGAIEAWLKVRNALRAERSSVENVAFTETRDESQAREAEVTVH